MSAKIWLCRHSVAVIAVVLVWVPSPRAQSGAPRYEVDVSWPKPFPDRWVIGGDVYVSDGESRNGNRRIAVIDRHGTFLRQWQPAGMQTVHCMTVSADGWVYVCNREGSRIQVYDKLGAFAKNIDVPWRPYTPPANGADSVPRESGGSAVSLELSRDSRQRLMCVINQNNSQVETIDRASGKLLSSVGRGAGHFPGQFDQPHGLAVDSQGNIYVTENRGKRVQKFKVVSR